MAQLETSDNSVVYASDFTLAAGAIAAAAINNFNGSSKALSIVRKTAGGTPGVPKIQIVAPTGSGAANAVWKLGMYSSSATDTSVYTFYWLNQYITSPYYAQTGATAGVQYAP
jgi:hypothetical protein